MSNQIRITISGGLSGTYTDTIASRTDTFTQAAAGFYIANVTCAQAAESDVSLAGVTTPGRIVLKNTDADNFITYGPKSGGSMVGFGELKPGESATFRFTRTSPTLRWRADTADCGIEVRLYND